MSSFRYKSVQDDTIELKKSLLLCLDTLSCDPSTVTSKEKKCKRGYIRNIEKYRSLNKTVVEVMPNLNQNEHDAKTSKYASISRRTM